MKMIRKNGENFIEIKSATQQSSRYLNDLNVRNGLDR